MDTKQQESIESFFFILEKWQEQRYDWLKDFLVKFSDANSELLPDLLKKLNEVDSKYSEIEELLNSFK